MSDAGMHDGATPDAERRAEARERRGDAAMLALGRLDPDEAATRRAAFAADPAAAAELAELEAAARLLDLVDPQRLDPAPAAPPPELLERILRAAAEGPDAAPAAPADLAAAPARRRRPRWPVAAAAAAALVAAAALGVWRLADRGPGFEAFDVAAPGAAGEYALRSENGGTRIELHVRGLEAKQYWLWLTAADNQRTPAGTWRGDPEEEQRLVFTAALPLDRTVRVWATDTNGEQAVVLDDVVSRS